MGSVVVGQVPVDSTGCCHSEQEPATHDFRGPEMERETWAFKSAVHPMPLLQLLGIHLINAPTAHFDPSMLSTLNGLDTKLCYKSDGIPSQVLTTMYLSIPSLCISINQGRLYYPNKLETGKVTDNGQMNCASSCSHKARNKISDPDNDEINKKWGEKLFRIKKKKERKECLSP